VIFTSSVVFTPANAFRYNRKELFLSQRRKERKEISCIISILQDILLKNFASLAALREMSSFP
jgi:hypothetical protein